MRVKVLVAAAWVLFGILIIKALWIFALSSPPSDAYILQGVGRGILNGLHPYSDLYETKAVGSFYLSALSLWISGGFATLYVLNILGFLLILLMMMDLLRGQSRVIFAAGMFLVLMLDLYNLAYGFYADYYANVVACVGIYAFIRVPKRVWKIILGALCMGTVLLLREPVSAVMVAGLLLFCRRLRDGIDLALVSIGAIAFAVFCLVLLGDWHAYEVVYLRNLTTTRVSEANSFLRALTQWDVLPHFLSFSPAFLLAILGILTLQLRSNRRFFLIIPLALYITNLAVNTATLTNMFYADFAVPLLFAILILYAISVDRRTRWAIIPGVAALLLIAPSVLRAKPDDTPPFESIAVAQAVDHIMEACAIDRYFHYSTRHEIPGMTVHSPLGPLFFLDGQFLRDERLIANLLTNVRKADLVVSERNVKFNRPDEYSHYVDSTLSAINSDFTSEPWLCAGDVPVFDHFVIMFRKNRVTPARSMASPAGPSS